MRIGNREISEVGPPYVVAEMSANHAHDLERGLQTIRAAKRAGADAIKVQTYRAKDMTLSSDRPEFKVGAGTPWEGRTLFDLYDEAHTPWDWHEELQRCAHEEGLDFFSTAFSEDAVRLLEKLNVPVHKIASFELVDLDLIRQAASTGKPLILSTGMATEIEIEEAVATARSSGATDLMLLKCTSAYPAPAEEMNLRTIPDMRARFGVPVGLSDHTLTSTAAVVAVGLGACLIEKHFTLSRDAGGPDSSFSLEPDELANLVEELKRAKASLGSVSYDRTEHEKPSLVFRRSLFVVADMAEGERFTRDKVRAIRPGLGLLPKHMDEVVGGFAARPISRGTPLTWDLVRKA